MVIDECFVLALQGAKGRQECRVEANERIPCAPLHHRFVQAFPKKEVASILPAPAQAEMANGRNERYDGL